MKIKKWSLLLSVLLCLVLPAHATSIKNVIWVIGDGMGPEILGFWMQGIRYGKLPGYTEGISNTEKLMNKSVWGMYFNNTYDTIVTDSAASATQMATGKFSRPLYVGIDYNRKPVPTLLEVARQHGKAIGIISDAYVTDATPACFTAHTFTRHNKADIARQQIALAPEVILGGGLKYFEGSYNPKLLQRAKEKGYQIVKDNKQLAAIKDGKILGLFAEKGMPMAIESSQHPTLPSLTQMTQKALEVLEQDPDGFVLMVEAGKIDWAAHSNDAGSLFAEMKNFDQLIGYLAEYAEQHPDTLLYINADHDTGLGAFTYHHVDSKQASAKAAQGEALYDGNVDYAHFSTYRLLDKQTRNLYDMYRELQAIDPQQRTKELIQKKLSEALGYEVDMGQFHDIQDIGGIIRQINAQRGLVFATTNHSSAALISLAYGPGAHAFGGVYHNTDIFPRLMQELKWESK